MIAFILTGLFDDVSLKKLYNVKPQKYRIIHHRGDSEIFYAIALAETKDEILEDWNWIEKNLMPVLESFEGNDDVSDFIFCKIQSLILENKGAKEVTEKDGSINRICVFLLDYY